MKFDIYNIGKLSKFNAIIIVLGIIVYANSLQGEFVSDDIPTIVNNPLIRSVTPTLHLPRLTHSIIYKLFALNPIPYHAVNLIVHICVSLLTFFLLRQFFDLWPSFWGSLIFVTHPIHTEAVSWVSGYPYTLLAMHMLSSLLLYRRATSEKKVHVSFYSAAIVLYIFSLFSNWYGLIYPFLIIFL